MECLKKKTSFLKIPVVRRIWYVYNSCMGLALLSLHIPAKKCIFSIDDGPFWQLSGRGPYTPLAIL